MMSWRYCSEQSLRRTKYHTCQRCLVPEMVLSPSPWRVYLKASYAQEAYPDDVYWPPRRLVHILYHQNDAAIWTYSRVLQISGNRQWSHSGVLRPYLAQTGVHKQARKPVNCRQFPQFYPDCEHVVWCGKARLRRVYERALWEYVCVPPVHLRRRLSKVQEPRDCWRNLHRFPQEQSLRWFQ